MKSSQRILFPAGICFIAFTTHAQHSISFQVELRPSVHQFHVMMKLDTGSQGYIMLKIPGWTPGYYQLLHFADHVSDFSVSTIDGKEIAVVHERRNGWKFATGKQKQFTVQYNITTKRSFVATPYLDENRGYLAPTGVFMYVSGSIKSPASVEVQLPEGWTMATGLEAVNKRMNRFTASNFDVLYDSSILMGSLEALPPFKVQGIPHRFIGYKLGDFDRAGFMNDLKKIVEAGVGVIGDIPYKHYTFIAIGPGPGGIEHLNSTTFGFSSDALITEYGRKRINSILSYEYIYHYLLHRIQTD